MIKIIPLLLACNSAALASIKMDNEPRKSEEALCGGVEPLDMAPDRPLKFGYETNLLLLLTKPYIAKEREGGILSRWHFTNENKTLVAEVSPSAVWSDGRRVTAQEAILGLLSGLRNRSLSKSIKLKKDSGLPTAEILLTKPPDSVRVIDQFKFEIDFDGNVTNIAGILVDALNENSRINRVWPIKLNNGQRVNDLVAKSKLMITQEGITILASEDTRVKIVYSEESCKNADYYLSSSQSSELENNFNRSYSNDEQALILIFNPKNDKTKSVHQRIAIAKLARTKLTGITTDKFRSTTKLIQENEPGYNFEKNGESQINNPGTVVPQSLIKIRPWAKVPAHWRIKTALEAGKPDEVAFRFDSSNEGAELLLTVSPVRRGRLLSLENGTIFNEISHYRESFPETFRVLEKFRNNSNTSVPRDPALFSELQMAISNEISIIPLGRFRITLHSKKSSRLILAWNKNGEIEFQPRRQK
jgi:hypothetical protein